MCSLGDLLKIESAQATETTALPLARHMTRAHVSLDDTKLCLTSYQKVTLYSNLDQISFLSYILFFYFPIAPFHLLC